MNAVDLFAGCGGLSLGFQNAGIQLSAAFELWDRAAECYAMNFEHPIYRMDLSDVTDAAEQIAPLSPDLIIGGPPCQDFSHAGKRIEADRASLTESYARIIQQIRPRYFVMENVDRAQKSQAYAQAETIFKDAGYGLTETVLDACRCGVPQKRKRFFCIGALGESDGFLKEGLASGLSDKDMTLRDYFGDTLDFQYYYRHPRNYNRRAVFSIDEPAPTMRGVNRPVPKGYPGHPNDACPVSDNIRALTTLERSLIQTFPAEFKWCGNKTEMEQMIGNAVPVKLAEYVARKLLDYIASTETIEHNKDQFVDWLIEIQHFTPRSAGDTLSRVRRADRICPMKGGGEYYYYLLLQSEGYSSLSTAVRSQIKRSLLLYNNFLHSQNQV